MRLLLLAFMFLLVIAPAGAEGTAESSLQARLQAQAEAGDVQAQHDLGEQYFKARDYPNAETWFLKAAEQGHGGAALRLGFLYAETHFPGVKTDYALAEHWFTKAAEADAGDGRFRLGNFYHYYVTPPKYDKSLHWLTLAAEGGHRIAMHDLAVLHKEGHAGDRDLEKWLYWMTKAAENGVLAAQIKLSRAYETGENVEQNPEIAHHWALQIANSKRAGVFWLNKVGDTYYDDGAMDEAAKWYEKAARKGDPQAKARLENLRASPPAE